MSMIKEICSLWARVTFQRFTQELLVDFRLCKYNSFPYEILRRFLQPLIKILGIKALQHFHSRCHKVLNDGFNK